MLKLKVTKKIRSALGALVLLLSLGSLLATFASLAAHASPKEQSDGPGTSGGGDALVAEFLSVARDLVAQVPIDVSDKTFLPLRNLKNAVEECSVESTDDSLRVNGVLKDAINYPDAKKIIFNRRRWQSLKDPSLKKILVLHEFLGLIRADDSKYQISSEFIKRMDNLDFNPVPAAPSECIAVLNESSCNVAFGSRAEICLQARSQLALRSLKIALNNTSCDLSDEKFRKVIQVNSPLQLGCMMAIDENQCSIGFGDRANLCLDTQSTLAYMAASIALKNTSCDLSDRNLNNALKVYKKNQFKAYEIIDSSGCNLEFGDRTSIALEYESETALDALKNTAENTSCDFSDHLMRTLSKM